MSASVGSQTRSVAYTYDAADRVKTVSHNGTVYMGCRKTSEFLSRETGISGNFVGRIKGAKCPFDLQFLTWDFS